jgi:uncharacterized membrane protein HdeD (DUF308 family)
MTNRDLQGPLLDFLLKYRKLFLFEGIIFTLLGIFALAAPIVFSMTLDIIFGWLFLVGGIAQGIRTVRTPDLPHRTSSLISTFVYLLLGLLFLAYPASGILALDLLLGCFFVFDGVTKIYGGLQLRPVPAWGWMIFSGILSLCIALLILANWPQLAAQMLGILVGINLLFSGLATLGFLWGISKRS